MGVSATEVPLLCAVYISSAVELMEPRRLHAMLTASRARNARAGISGMLLYKEGAFMQLIEGPADVVCVLLRKIQIDPRHRGMTVLYCRPITQRTFASWSMAFQNVDELGREERESVSRYLDDPFTLDAFGDHPDRAVLLLQNFKKYIR
jgi:hypothetical protein